MNLFQKQPKTSGYNTIPNTIAVDDETAAHPGQLLGEREATEVPIVLHLIQQCDLRRFRRLLSVSFGICCSRQ